MTSAPPPRDAAYFDQWYADMAASPDRDRVHGRALGLPSELVSNNSLPWDGLAELTAALRLPSGGLLIDLGCGRGGCGIEIARRTGARLVGVDFSAVALDQARAASARQLSAGQAAFTAGTLTATGLPGATADAVLCVDAIQFADPPLAGLRECLRLLTPGGSLVLTCWEAVDPADERVPARIRALALERDLDAAGFADVRVQGKPGWRAAERQMWQDAVDAPRSGPAVASLQDEGRRSLATWDSLRRVLATATAPGPS